MNNYYTLIYLTGELKENLKESLFTEAVTTHKNRLDLYFQTTSEEMVRLCISTDSGNTGAFQGRYAAPKARNALRFFESSYGSYVNNIELSNRDRLVSISLDSGEIIVLQLFGTGANIFLVRDNTIIQSFKNQKRYNGQKAPEARKPHVKKIEELKGSVLKRLTSLNPLLPRNLLPDLIEYFRLDQFSDAELFDFEKQLHHILTHEAVPALMPDGRVCLLPEHFFPVEGRKTLAGFNDCVRSSYYYRTGTQRYESRRTNLSRRLGRHQGKLQNKMNNLLASGKSLERSERYEKYGHLLMANLYQPLQSDSEQIEVEDLYDEGNKLSIPIKKGVNLSENAALYYEKSREARKAYEKAEELFRDTEDELNKANTLLEGLNQVRDIRDLETWIKSNEAAINETGITSSGEGQKRYPYRKLMIDPYEIRIGKNAKSNDELLRDAHKEDIWLHARGYAGSHVIIRMGKNTGYPDKTILEKAGRYAAKHSKGAGSSIVPVIYAKRKHVRKPKGGAPGEVKVVKEQVILVDV